MRRFVTSLALFVEGLRLLSGKGEAAPVGQGAEENSKDLNPVKLRPLNLAGDNQFAAHRSHSSHASHQSHRSGSGGSVAPSPDPSASPPPSGASPSVPGTNQLQPAVPSSPAPSQPAPQLRPAEKLKLQIMRIQIALTTLGLYSGPIDGVLSAATKESLKRFQTVKGMPPSGLMTTDTLNALGIPAVQ